jgi:hypothetical protein
VRRLLLGLAGTLVAGVLSLTPSAAHAETTLCSGKSFDETMKCDPGWAVNMMFMHWRMYRGHNCTNYVAWRLTRDGVQEPDYLLGNARSWADRAKRHGVPVNATPQVGAVGTWSGRNHVTYVEQVAPGWLLLTEDSWSSKRYRRYIVYKGERNYPTTFIHFAGKNAIRGATPTVTGTPLVGQMLRANAGVWSPKGVKLTYRWLRDGVVIPGATGTAHLLTRDDAGKGISVSITGTYPGKLSRTASSTATTPVSAGTITPATPEVTGDPIVGSYLVAVPGTWSPSYVTLNYQWYADGKKISGADERTWKVGRKRIGKAITVRVTGSGPGFTPVTAESAPSPKVVDQGESVGKVTAGTPTINTTPTMVVGDKVTVSPGTWGPKPVKLVARWMRDGQTIPRPASSWTYVLTAADIGKHIQVEFTGTKTNFLTASARTPETSAVYPRQLRPTSAPTITGPGLVGQDLLVNPGVWLPGGTQTSVQWQRDGKPIPSATATTYRVTIDDLQHKISAALTTQLKGWPVDKREVPAGVTMRTTPSIGFKSIPTEREHSKRLVINASVFGKPMWGRARIMREGKVLRTLGFSRGKSAVYDYVAEPGRYTLTLKYVGPDWLVPATRDIVVIVK